MSRIVEHMTDWSAELTTLDDEISDTLTYMKMDVEGAESFVALSTSSINMTIGRSDLLHHLSPILNVIIIIYILTISDPVGQVCDRITAHVYIHHTAYSGTDLIPSASPKLRSEIRRAYGGEYLSM